MIDPEVLARAVAAVQQATGAGVIAEMFRRSMAGNLPAVAEPLPDGTTFVLTGDIPAMWLRDSAAQLRPYLLLCKDDPGLQETLIGVLHRQLEYVVLDPYANAFNKEPNGAGHVTTRPRCRRGCGSASTRSTRCASRSSWRTGCGGSPVGRM